MRQIIPTAEPFFFPGSGENAKIGCLLIHGFTGAPKEMRWMGEYLAREGFSVLGVRLTGHATRPEDMIRARYTDWLASVEDGYHLLRGVAEQIYLVGLSMGGILSLVTATRLEACPEGVARRIAGVVVMSTPYKLLDDPRIRWAKQISRFIPYVPKGGAPDAGWYDKESFKQHVSYPQNPIRSVSELNQLMAVMHESLPKVRAPVLLIHSRDDDYVVKDSMAQIYAHLGSSDKQMMWVEGGGHVITEEPTREAVFKAAADFICRVNSPQSSRRTQRK